jgi:hypothetical protein
MAPKRRIYIPSRSGLGRKPILRLPEKIDMSPKPANPEIQRVQGIMPDSKEEFWVALALYKMHIDFVFQYQLFGGRKYKGGQVVDFWVYTMPLPTPIFVQGWYFHYATAEKAARSKLNLMYLESRLAGKAMKPVEILDTEIPTPDDAYIVVKRKLHR